MEIISLIQGNQQWDLFLKNNEHLIFHTPTYKKFIEEAFDCEYKVLAGVIDKKVESKEIENKEIENKEIKIIFPLIEIKSRLFGNKLISSAYLEYGGFAGDETYITFLIDFLDKESKEKNNYLEIRGGLEKFDIPLSSKMVPERKYKRFVLKLGSEKETWKNIQHSKRKAINRSLRELEVKEVSFSELDEFYNLYCHNMRSFGSPPYSKKYFISFYENLVKNKLGKVFGSCYQGKLVSALLGFCYRERVHIIIAVSDEKYQELRPNDAMHWKFIQWAIQNGFKWFDFGRVREESGQFEYKQKWGPELLELPSYFLLWKSKEIPFVDPSSRKYKIFTKMWQKMPLSVTKLTGMKLRKGLGI